MNKVKELFNKLDTKKTGKINYKSTKRLLNILEVDIKDIENKDYTLDELMKYTQNISIPINDQEEISIAQLKKSLDSDTVDFILHQSKSKNTIKLEDIKSVLEF